MSWNKSKNINSVTRTHLMRLMCVVFLPLHLSWQSIIGLWLWDIVYRCLIWYLHWVLELRWCFAVLLVLSWLLLLYTHGCSKVLLHRKLLLASGVTTNMLLLLLMNLVEVGCGLGSGSRCWHLLYLRLSFLLLELLLLLHLRWCWWVLVHKGHVALLDFN